ncbi:hypothetical protein KAFR_0B04670 [Kazachstania africana CBS 2517]|uniref:Peroxisomal membrane protein PEX14 n=1 Tax=Kazachstania africana (strain ATCC 22294 / BCRC 22015 / CBS 2517 / CECT 1963 / NBRC 1671 / NRRL Y-8276) TaxID=1071382 RepID=H2AQW4_KAZAF|nr:hypothetical protein KAFR_0B04670 [Kazachstania africana CBS 2517]CCF56764.1 hypothetical protein KAFR_0B04670 [Kazachstania africana CBS 2517]
MINSVPEDRAQLYNSAVAFLTDDSIKDAPLANKIEFLQSKGLNEHEIELALKQSKEQKSNASNDVKVNNDTISPDFMYEAIPPPLPQRDWKDYFVMATATAGLFYGLHEVTKRYILPNILPQSKTKLEQDKDEINSQFDKVDKVLNAIEQGAGFIQGGRKEKLDELDATIVQLKAALEQTTTGRKKVEDDFRLLKSEMNNLQHSIQEFVSKNGAIKEINKISEEVSSLKSLMNNTENSVNSSNKADRRDTENCTKSVDNELKKQSPLQGIPGIEAIPSASELLAKMNLTDNVSSSETENTIPAWKKAREDSLLSNSAIPEWQKNSSTATPSWQTALEDAEQNER